MLRRFLPTGLRTLISERRERSRLADAVERGRRLAHGLTPPLPPPPTPEHENPLSLYFAGHREGPGIWKWQHYFDVYHRHLAKFVGKAPVIVEVGIFSGGSLPMWLDYFGPGTTVHGVDIEPACRAYASDRVRVHIGDQEDRAFWRAFRANVPHVDVFIDDGGHLPSQQAVTLEEMLPHMAPGGVFLCEDIHGTRQSFADLVHGLVAEMNSQKGLTAGDDPERRVVVPAAPVHATVEAICFYPYMAVIEKRTDRLDELRAPKRGTMWQPHLG